MWKKSERNKKSVKKVTLVSWCLGWIQDRSLPLSFFFLIASIAKKKEEGTRPTCTSWSEFPAEAAPSKLHARQINFQKERRYSWIVPVKPFTYI